MQNVDINERSTVIQSTIAAYRMYRHVPASKGRALVAMSGGVDSTVAVALMVAQGYETIGATLKLRSEKLDLSTDRSCCSPQDIEDAARAAAILGCQHMVLDHTIDFEKEVVDRFVNAYLMGATPNPCVDCNRLIKFASFFDKRNELGFDVLVTGHYARTLYDPTLKRWLLLKGRDHEKDQSYVLYNLTQEQLAHTRFPCGEFSKEEIRQLAVAIELPLATKPDSQDICFIPNGKYHEFIQKYTGHADETGRFYLFKNGQDMGPHKGFSAYTIGQRRGLGISYSEPLYVVDKDPRTKAVYLGHNDDLMQRYLVAHSVNWIYLSNLNTTLRCTAKIRYSHKEAPCTVRSLDNGTVEVLFDEPVRAITRGQSIVFYQDDYVLGGGVIATQGQS